MPFINLAQTDLTARKQIELLSRGLEQCLHQQMEFFRRPVETLVEDRGTDRALLIFGSVVPMGLAANEGEVIRKRRIQVIDTFGINLQQRAIGSNPILCVELGTATAIVVLKMHLDAAVGVVSNLLKTVWLSVPQVHRAFDVIGGPRRPPNLGGQCKGDRQQLMPRDSYLHMCSSERLMNTTTST
jgi:hypothetical protein